MKKTAILLCLFVLSGTVAFAGAPMPPMHGGQGLEQMAEHDAKSMLGPLAALEGRNFDVAFYSMMIPHHQAAVDMARKVEATTDPQVKKWAEQIVETQSAEIKTMQTAVEKIGGIDPMFYAMMDKDMRQMVEATKSDRDFVEQMIPHHGSAIEMAKLAPTRTKNPELLTLCEAIVDAQTDEIAEFEAWLEK